MKAKGPEKKLKLSLENLRNLTLRENTGCCKSAATDLPPLCPTCTTTGRAGAK